MRELTLSYMQRLLAGLVLLGAGLTLAVCSNVTRPKEALMRSVIVLILSITTATAAVGGDDPAQKVNQLFATFDKPGSPGCSSGVIRNGSFAYKKSFGYTSLELGGSARTRFGFLYGLGLEAIHSSKHGASSDRLCASRSGGHRHSCCPGRPCPLRSAANWVCRFLFGRPPCADSPVSRAAP
jgi:hypothetical protein